MNPVSQQSSETGARGMDKVNLGEKLAQFSDKWKPKIWTGYE
jgi:hypothetical protein